MKKALFETLVKNKKIRGTVTLMSNGKVSISIADSGYYSLNEKWMAKEVAKKIAAYDFVHGDVLHLEVIDENKGVLPKLRELTQELKEKYISRVVLYTKKDFSDIQNRVGWSKEEWFEKFSIPFEYKTEFRTQEIFPILANKSEREAYHLMKKAKIRDKAILTKGLEKYLEEEIGHANNHYEKSLLKLTQRLLEKGIADETSIEITKETIGENINMTIKHGENITKAWTIVAYGEIQRPHYRYLVK